jgi:dTDP-4-amino-4,6-dideoxy-D-galactose acyltransferase
VTTPSLLSSRLDDVKPLLLESLPWSPHDFIRNISTAGDRAFHIAPLVRDIDPADDLRITHGDPSMELALCAERLPWDSAFFGYNVARLHGIFPLSAGGYSAAADYTPAVRALCRFAQDRGIRYLFSVVDARDLPTIRALTTAGFALLETRCLFYRSIRDYRYPRRFQCRPATAEDLDSLFALARNEVNPYDRFRADPFIAPEDAGRLMETWIRASVLDGFADATFVPDRKNPAAVCTLKYHRDKWPAWGTAIAQGIFALGSPRAGGWVMRIFSEANYHLQELGVDYVFYTTQIANRPAVRVSQQLNYKLGRCEHVLRILL